MPEHYVVYGGELSLFTRKLTSALHFYGASWELRSKADHPDENVEVRSGTHQVPVLHTPENWMIADTTPLLLLLDGRFPARRMFPDGPLGVLVHVLEEHFDEWIARVMVHYRWHYPDSARFAALRMSAGDAQAAQRIAQWGPRACRATGTESPSQQRAAEAEYERLLAAAERQLQDTAFLLGDRPTALDCIVLGGLRAHTNMDPDPKRVTARFPVVVDWAQRRADTWDGGGELAPFPDSTAFAHHVLGEMPSTYVPYVLANRAAQAAGARACTATTWGEQVSYLSRPYPERSRAMVRAHIDRLPADQRTTVEDWLQAVELAAAFD